MTSQTNPYHDYQLKAGEDGALCYDSIIHGLTHQDNVSVEASILGYFWVKYFDLGDYEPLEVISACKSKPGCKKPKAQAGEKVGLFAILKGPSRVAIHVHGEPMRLEVSVDLDREDAQAVGADSPFGQAILRAAGWVEETFE